MRQALHKTEKERGKEAAVVPASKVLHKGLHFPNPTLARMQILQKWESIVLE